MCSIFAKVTKINNVQRQVFLKVYFIIIINFLLIFLVYILKILKGLDYENMIQIMFNFCLNVYIIGIFAYY